MLRIIERGPGGGDEGRLSLPSAYSVQGKYGYVVGGHLTSVTGHVDGEFGAWFVQQSGAIRAYYGSALRHTGWPPIGEGRLTERIGEARSRARANAG